jgi:hypothetical protein
VVESGSRESGRAARWVGVETTRRKGFGWVQDPAPEVLHTCLPGLEPEARDSHQHRQAHTRRTTTTSTPAPTPTPSEESSSSSSRTHIVILELGIPPLELIIHITRQILEPIPRQRRELLPRLVPLRMEVVSDGEEGCGSIGPAGLYVHPTYEFVVHVGGEFLELELGESGELFSGGCSCSG